MVLAGLGSFKLQDGDSVVAAARCTAARLFRTCGMKAEAAEAEITLGFCLHVSGASEGLPTMDSNLPGLARGCPGVEIEGWLHLARIWARQGEHDRAEEAFTGGCAARPAVALKPSGNTRPGPVWPR